MAGPCRRSGEARLRAMDAAGIEYRRGVAGGTLHPGRVRRPADAPSSGPGRPTTRWPRRSPRTRTAMSRWRRCRCRIPARRPTSWSAASASSASAARWSTATPASATWTPPPTTTKPQYLPFWERVAAAGRAVLPAPPQSAADPAPLSTTAREALLGPTWAFTVETATHCLRMMVSGLFDRFPGLTVIIGHMGELLPFAVERTEQRLSHVPSVAWSGPPQECLRENFFWPPAATSTPRHCSARCCRWGPTGSCSPPTIRSSAPPRRRSGSRHSDQRA